MQKIVHNKKLIGFSILIIVRIILFTVDAFVYHYDIIYVMQLRLEVKYILLPFKMTKDNVAKSYHNLEYFNLFYVITDYY